MSDRIPHRPDDSIIRLGIITDNLMNTAWQDIVDCELQHETGETMSGYAALKHIAFVLDCIAESSLDYAKAKGAA